MIQVKSKSGRIESINEADWTNYELDGFTKVPSTTEVPSGTNGTSKRILPVTCDYATSVKRSQQREATSLGLPGFAKEGETYICKLKAHQDNVKAGGDPSNEDDHFGSLQLTTTINGAERTFRVLNPIEQLIPTAVGAECKVSCNKTTSVQFPLSMQIVA